MYAKELSRKLRLILSVLGAELSVYIKGAPGVGKSAIVYQVAKELGYEVRTLIASTCDPIDIRGCLRITEDGENSVWVPPKFFCVPKGQKVLFFFDELSTATPSVQATFYRIILEGKLDTIDISHCPRIGAGNRDIDMAVVNRMPTPLVSRFHHITLEPSLEDWKEWAYGAGIKDAIISFLNFRRDLLHQMPKSRDTPFPTPRTYEFLSKLLTALGDEVTVEDVSGLIGDGTATEFMAFLKVFDELPKTPQEVLTKGVHFKGKPDRQYAVNGILVNYFRTKATKEVAGAILDYSYKLEEEFAVCLVKDCILINRPMVASNPEFRRWTAKYQNIIL